VPGQAGTERRNNVRQLAHLSRLMAFHAAPLDGADRHDSYIDFLINERRNQPLVCDFTHDYMILGSRDFAEMATIGSARFVMVLRDPATRFWAHLWERQKIKGRDVDALIEAVRTLSDDPEQMANWPATDYNRTMTELEKAVDPSRVFYLFHENLAQPNALNPLFEFLGVPPTQEHRMLPLPDENLPKLPPRLRTKLRKLLVPQYKSVRARFGEDNLPKEWADREASRKTRSKARKGRAKGKDAKSSSQGKPDPKSGK
jgi:hypothetical protein